MDLYIDNERTDILRTSFAINWKWFDLTKLSKRFSVASTNMQIPFTVKNKSIFSYTDIPNASLVPIWTEKEAKIYFGNYMALVGSLKTSKISIRNKYFQTSITGHNGIIDSLNDKTPREVMTANANRVFPATWSNLQAAVDGLYDGSDSGWILPYVYDGYNISVNRNNLVVIGSAGSGNLRWNYLYISLANFLQQAADEAGINLKCFYNNVLLWFSPITIDTQDSIPRDVVFGNSGAKMYELGDSGNLIYEYDVSTPYDITTAVYLQQASNQDTSARGIFFKPDGLKYYEIGDNSNIIREIDLSVAWDITTGTYSGVNISNQSPNGSGVIFKPDGLRMYEIGYDVSLTSMGYVYEYTLTVAWDLSTASYTRLKSFGTNAPTGGQFNSTGTIFIEMESSTAKLRKYTLSTAWNVTTASYVSVNVATKNLDPSGFCFNNDGTKMYEVGTVIDKIYELDLSVAYDISTLTNTNPFYDIVREEYVAAYHIGIKETAAPVMTWDDSQLLFINPDGTTISNSDLIIAGGKSTWELFKVFALHYNLGIYLDQSSKELTFYDMNNANRDVLDWTDKLIKHDKCPIISGYAKTNYIKYKPTDNLDSVFGQITISNNTDIDFIDKEKTINTIDLTIPGIYDLYNGSGILTLTNMFQFNLAENKTAYKSSIFLYKANQTSVLITVQVGSGTQTATKNLYKMGFLDNSSFYNWIEDEVLENNELHDCEIDINLADLVDLKPWDIVRIKNIGEKLYINQIRNLNFNKPAKVQLVKLA